jgi:hypothetical protein
MNLTNLFENTTPSNNYCDQLAEKLPAGLKSNDDILDAAWDIVVKDLGRKVAHNKFMDEDFPGDLIGAYNHMHKQGVEEGGPYDLPGIDYPRPGDTPAKPRYRGQSSPGVIPDDEDYFREIFRKKREAAANTAQDKGVAEGQLNEYLVKGGMPVNDVLALNLFQDFDPQEGAAAQFAEFAQEPMWKQVVRKYAPIANMLKKKLLATKRPLTDAEAEAVEQTWYDGSDAYDDMEIEYLVDIYDQQIDTLEALLAGNLTDEEFGEGLAEDDNAETEFYVYIGNESDGGWVGRVIKDSGKWREVGGEGNRPHNWGGTYMSYLTPADIMQWIRQDYRRYEVSGPFMDDTEAYDYAEQMGGLDPLDEQGVAEADKKKEDELGTEVRDVGLQRAIARAKSDFPTAGSGIEALAKDLMRGQEQDKQDFEKIRAVDKDQERMLAQIAQVDQDQTKEIGNLEQDNTTLKRRLQQIQSVNARLEKTLASMSGRKKEKTTPADTGTSTFSPAAGIPDAPATATSKPKTKSKTKAKAQPAKSSMKSTAAQLAAPKADPMSAMTQRITKGDSSITDKVSGQQALSFGSNDNVLEPAISQAQQNPRFAAARRDASDVDPKYYADVARKVARSPAEFAAAMGGVNENEKEAKYSDKYQDMVARVGQKAREQEKSKPVDIKDLARRLAAIDAKDKSAR